MTDVLNAVIGGAPIGCVFALLAVGLVLTYRTAGVFNLAFGAQAFVSAAVYYDTRVRHEWPIPAALLLSVFVVAPLLGYLLDRSLFRHLRTASSIAKLVTTLGLLVAIPEITKLWFGGGASFGVKGIWPTTDEIGGPTIYRWGDYAVDGNQVATVLVTLVAVVALTAMFRWSQLGLRMRATVESPRMTELAGINADRISTSAWLLSSLFAGLAGVLLAPLFSQINNENFLFLLIAAMAAAAFGSLRSIPLTLVGGIALGIGYQLLYTWLPPGSILSQGLRPALPFVALFLLLLFWPGLRNRREAADPLAGVDPPPPAPAAALRTRSMTIATRVLAVAVFLFISTGVAWFFDDFWVLLFVTGIVYAVIFCSITVITGMAGLLSLSQAAFAGIGAFTTAQLVDRFDMQVLVAILVGAALAALVGGVFALPVLRLEGLYLALATLAFAAMFQFVIVPQDWAGGQNLQIPRPIIGPLDFSSTRAYYFLCLVFLGLVERGRPPHQAGNRRALPGRPAGQRGRRRLGRHRPPTGPGDRLRPVRGHRRPRRGPAGRARRSAQPPQLQLHPGPGVGRARGHARTPGHPGGHHRGDHVQALPGDHLPHRRLGVPRHAQPRPEPSGAGLRPLRPRCPHLRQTPRGDHRVPDGEVPGLRQPTDPTPRGQRRR